MFDKERIVHQIALTYLDFDPLENPPSAKKLIRISQELRELSDEDLIDLMGGMSDVK